MIAIKPPMGWNSWNTFGKDINDSLIRQIADTMVEKGYLEAGYEYLIIGLLVFKRKRCRRKSGS